MCISLIIPTYNGQHLLAANLAHNLAILGPDVECIIADDASTDDTARWLAANLPLVKVVVSDKNRGFAATAAMGAAHASGEFLFFLNNDMQIVSFDSEQALAVLREDMVFALVPTLVRPAKDNAFESYTWGKFAGGWLSAESYLPAGSLRTSTVGAQPSNHQCFPSGEGVGGSGVPILWACGGAMLVSRQKYEALGGFDPMFSPFYFEDLDLSYRAWKRGWESRYLDFALVHHEHQATIGSLFTRDAVEHIHRTHHYLFMWKNLDDRWFLISHLLTVLVKVITLQIKDIRAIGAAILRLPQIGTYRRIRPKPCLKDSEILGRSGEGC